MIKLTINLDKNSTIFSVLASVAEQLNCKLVWQGGFKYTIEEITQ